MNKDRNVNKVSKRLREHRKAKQFHYILNNADKQYETQMWNSDDVQFLALWFAEVRHSATSRQTHHEIRLDFFAYRYDSWTQKRTNALTKETTISIPAEKTSKLRDFLIQKPTDETFTLASYKGNIHLTFEKRSLWGKNELRSRFLHNQEEWNNAARLPRKERNSLRKEMKAKEKRAQLWFDDLHSEKLSLYLDSVLPE